MSEMRGPVRHPGCGSKSQQRRRRRLEQGQGRTRSEKKPPRRMAGM